MTPEERFWSKVDIRGPDDCWEWIASRKKQGYGQFGVSTGKMKLSHRIAYHITYGPIPKGIEILHHCDNPPCCNPRHLFSGTHKTNMEDMATKKRSADVKGTKGPNAKLTESQVKCIRALYIPRKCSQRKLAKQFGVSQFAIRCIIDRKTWSHI